MARSIRKGPYVAIHLQKKIREAEATNIKRPIKVWCRDSTIIPEMIGKTFAVHNGKDFVPVFIVDDMVGHKLGEFSMTRTFKAHSGDRKAKGK